MAVSEACGTMLVNMYPGWSVWMLICKVHDLASIPCACPDHSITSSVAFHDHTRFSAAAHAVNAAVTSLFLLSPYIDPQLSGSCQLLYQIARGEGVLHEGFNWCVK